MAEHNIPSFKTQVFYFFPYESDSLYVKVLAENKDKAIVILEREFGKDQAHSPRLIETASDYGKGFYGTLIQYTDTFHKRNLIP